MPPATTEALSPGLHDLGRRCYHGPGQQRQATLSESIATGLIVLESPAREDDIPLRRPLVTAFVGPAPRGPVHQPVALRSVAEFRHRFGSPVERSRMELMLEQYFSNGGVEALVVRVPRSGGRSRVVLPGAGGPLRLQAVNPGPLEYVRVSVDHDGLHRDPDAFNLTIQRILSPATPLVEEQEVWRGLSVDPDSDRFVGILLEGSILLRVEGEVPGHRPDLTPGRPGVAPIGYVEAEGSWQHSQPPTDYDLVGSARDCTGIHALDQVATVDVVCLLSGAPDADLGPVALFAAERYCAARHALLLVDPPAHWDSVEAVLKAQRERWLTSPNVVTYFPRLSTGGRPGRGRTLSAAGAIAGLLAGMEEARGAAAPLPYLRSRLAPAVLPEDEDVPALVRCGVNLLRPDGAPGRLRLEGWATQAGHAGPREWRQLLLRRRALRIVGGISRGTRWSAVAPNTPDTRSTLVRQVRRYLEACAGDGLLAPAREGLRPFYVKCDEDTSAGRPRAVLIVGLALERAGDYVAFRFLHDAGDCRVGELSWQPGLALAG